MFALTLARGAGEAGRHTGSCWASVGVSRRQCAAHPGQLLLGGHLLGDQRGLDPVEKALEPADKLSLRDPQLGIARRPRTEMVRVILVDHRSTGPAPISVTGFNGTQALR